MRHQVDTWRRLDFHSRAANTLGSARSEQIARAAGIADATKSVRCTTCHAPFHDVPAARFVKSIQPTVGVSCESCHGPAESWLLTHTRKDLAHADRVASGLRDLRNLRTRANSCVACHQNVETALIDAGHPELMFEMDGQSVTQPRHWRERGNYSAAQAWLVGQAVALRELSAALAAEPGNANLAERWAALVWLLQKTEVADAGLSPLKGVSAAVSADNAKRVEALANELAAKAAQTEWSDAATQSLLKQLAATAPDFRDKGASARAQARRAERLVLALDRLVTTSSRVELDADVNQLFWLARAIPGFEPDKFAAALEQLAPKASSRVEPR